METIIEEKDKVAVVTLKGRFETIEYAEAQAKVSSLYEMDLLSAGEDYYAAMRRSTNGGGENSPLLTGEDDYYELFMEQLAGLKSSALYSLK